jgi:transcriptional regulator with XRE-family HTH domain
MQVTDRVASPSIAEQRRQELVARGLSAADLASAAKITQATARAWAKGRPVAPRTARQIAATLARVRPLPPWLRPR